ncbi:MAG: hypothetical protein ACP5G2_01710 [Candidatus Bipolaricaulaceae bacterium]
MPFGDLTGDVIDLGVFSFAVLEMGGWVDADQSTGRIVHVPCGKVFTEHVCNFTQGFDYIWNEVAVVITFESNWKKAKEILLDIARRRAEHVSADAAHWIRETSRRFLIRYGALTPTVYTRIADNGVRLNVRYLCAPRKRRDTEQEICEEVLVAFAREPDIDFAYPTWRVFDQTREGKPDLRAP